MNTLLEQAQLAVNAFIATHPGYTVSANQPAYQGGTNRILFGAAGGSLVTFKYFVTPERYRNELVCLRHYEATGLVPRVLHAVPDRLLVIERLPGLDLAAELARSGGDDVLVRHLSGQVGRALARLASIPLPPLNEEYSPIRDFTIIDWDMDLGIVLQRYIARCRRIQLLLPVYQTPFFRASLVLLEHHLGAVVRQRKMLFHEDIWNMIVDRDRFQGFFDLEMCRLGTEAMQLGVAISLCGPGKLVWDALVAGYEAEVGYCLDHDDLESVVAMNHFYYWIRICRWGVWNGNAEEWEHRKASEAAAEVYLTAMKDACRTLGRTVPGAAALATL